MCTVKDGTTGLSKRASSAFYGENWCAALWLPLWEFDFKCRELSFSHSPPRYSCKLSRGFSDFSFWMIKIGSANCDELVSRSRGINYYGMSNLHKYQGNPFSVHCKLFYFLISHENLGMLMFSRLSHRRKRRTDRERPRFFHNILEPTGFVLSFVQFFDENFWNQFKKWYKVQNWRW